MSRGSRRWSSWALMCIEALDALPKTDDPRELDARHDARAGFVDVERSGLEPYYTLKAYAVRMLGLDDGQ